MLKSSTINQKTKRDMDQNEQNFLYLKPPQEELE
jgi:hypothetical protein